jgi:hypothetical protein
MCMHVLLYSKRRQCTQSTSCNIFPCVGGDEESRTGFATSQELRVSTPVMSEEVYWRENHSLRASADKQASRHSD